MSEFWDKLKADLLEIWKQIQGYYYKLMGRQVGADGTVMDAPGKMSYEINLVPEVKAQMIHTQRVRNIVLFVCLVVSGVAVGTVLVLFGIKSGQDIAMSNQDKKLSQMSELLMGYDELEDLLTFQGQLDKISEIEEHKTVVSRVFGALGVMLQQGKDDVSLSELRMNLNSNTIVLGGQTDARVAPLIDYRVLEALKKSAALIKFDYGRYVDIDSKELPTQCIIETDDQGTALQKGSDYYAWWDLTIDGCQGATRSLSYDEDIQYHYGADSEVVLGAVNNKGEFVKSEEVKHCETNAKGKEVCTKEVIVTESSGNKITLKENDTAAEGSEEDEESSEGQHQSYSVKPAKVMIWRTPQYEKWYKSGLMTMTGEISGIPHFESVCSQYSRSAATGNWSSINDCYLVPEGMSVDESANARDDSDNLVLKFSASLTFSPEFFQFRNKHMVAIGPMGQNVTDSYVQIGGMFVKPAVECAPDDKECLENKVNNASPDDDDDEEEDDGEIEDEEE